jgi:CheY-like chemotaxis protein
MNATQPARALHILVVDDNRDAADSLALLVGMWGYRAVVAYDGPSAVQAAKACAPVAILLDLGLPGMDGYEVARLLRLEDGLDGALLLAVTGYGQAADRQRTAAAGFAHHLVKPVEPEDLRRLLPPLL